MMVKIKNVDFKFSDERGTLVQLIHDGWKQINVLKSPQGSHRGGHYHKINREMFYIIEGTVELILKQDKTEEKSTFSSGDMFLIESNLIHNFNFICDTVMVSMYDMGVEMPDGSKDIYN